MKKKASPSTTVTAARFFRSYRNASCGMLLTDPPYLVSYKGGWGSKLKEIEGDSDASWVAPVFGELYRILRPDSLSISCYGWPHADVFFRTWKSTGFRPVSVLVFVKSSFGLGYYTRAQHDQAYLLAKGKPPKPAAAISDVLSWEQSSPRLHPNQKPLGAFTKLVATYSPTNATILDPFAGAGTSLMASRDVGRSAIGIEIEERYCELAAMRLSQRSLQLSLVSLR